MGASALRRRSFALLLKRNARVWGIELSETVEFAFRRRYALPPTDARFLDASFAEILIDFWAHAATDDPKVKSEVVTEDFEAEMAALEAAAAKPDDADDWETVE